MRDIKEVEVTGEVFFTRDYPEFEQPKGLRTTAELKAEAEADFRVLLVGALEDVITGESGLATISDLLNESEVDIEILKTEYPKFANILDLAVQFKNAVGLVRYLRERVEQELELTPGWQGLESEQPILE